MGILGPEEDFGARSPDFPLRMRAGLLHANGITLLNSLHNSCAAHLI